MSLGRLQDAVATRVVHAADRDDAAEGAAVPAIVVSSVYRHGNPRGYSYGREHNSNWERLEAALAELEHGSGAVLYGSGMGAVAAVVEQVPPGGKIVVARDAYTGSREILAFLEGTGRCRVERVDATDIGEVAAACAGAYLVLVEALGNPLLSVTDIVRCAQVAHQAGALLAVDNTFATPLLLRPLQLGADLVIHSASKYLGGHSDLVLGIVVCADPERVPQYRHYRTHHGASPGELEVWLALRGLKTLDVRLRRQVENAQFLAEHFAASGWFERVHYPGLRAHPQHAIAAAQFQDGFGAMISVELAGSAERAEAVCAATRVWTNATSLGSVESLIERRGRWHGEEYLPPGLLRMSVGVEAREDLLRDIEQALGATAG